MRFGTDSLGLLREILVGLVDGLGNLVLRQGQNGFRVGGLGFRGIRD